MNNKTTAEDKCETQIDMDEVLNNMGQSYE